MLSSFYRQPACEQPLARLSAEMLFKERQEERREALSSSDGRNAARRFPVPTAGTPRGARRLRRQDDNTRFVEFIFDMISQVLDDALTAAAGRDRYNVRGKKGASALRERKIHGRF